MDSADILICGEGIVGLTIARELLKRGYSNIIILEKEEEIGKHASGRNSGVLHSGIYYTSDSLKARFCLEGNILMKEYCRERNIPVAETGKVVVTKTESEIPILKELYSRALKNNVKVELIDKKCLEEIEPYAKTCELALYSPYTAVVDPKSVMRSIEKDLLISNKVKILKGYKFKGLKNDNTAITNRGDIRFEGFINTAGSYSDSVAHSFGIGLNYKILPFKGTYKKIKKEKSYLVKGNIYPVPDLKNPFLGVHLTRAIDGTVYAGPTAIPALGRENYRISEDIGSETLNILYRDAILFMTNPEFRRVALTEPRKYILRFFYEDVKALVEGLDLEDIEPSEKVGIRPQLIDWEKKELVMDFVILRHGKSIHILNAISPALTSSMAFARFVVDNI